MSLLISNIPALILIDIQKGFDDIDYWGGQRNNPDAEFNASLLLELWRQQGLPLYHIQHCSSIPASPLHATRKGNRFMEIVEPIGTEPIIRKSVNSAFIGTDLKARLDGKNIDTVVIVGLTTDHCVSTTTRMAGNFGFHTFLVSDATATFCKRGMDGKYYSAELIHDTALASLHKEFAEVVTTQVVQQSL